MAAPFVTVQTPTEIQWDDGVVVRFDSATAPAATDGELVRRYDSSELARPEILPNGFMRFEGRIARAGVYNYQRADGSVWRELRPREVVFDPAAMRAFEGLPFTDEHPPGNKVTTANVRQVQRGQVGEPRPDGDHLRARILVTDKPTIESIKGGKVGLSAGYDARLVVRSGTWTRADGTSEPFDAVQMSCVPNHVALTDLGVAGREAVLRADSAGAVEVPRASPPIIPPPRVTEKTVKYTVNGKEYDIPDEVAAHITRVDSDRTRLETESKASKTELERTQGTLAAVQAEAAKTKAEADVAAAQARDAKLVEERLALSTEAAPILEKPIADVVRMDSKAIKVAVITKRSPTLDLTGKGEPYIDAAYDAVMASTRVDSSKTMAGILAGGGNAPPAVTGQGIDADLKAKAEAARAAMVKGQNERWKEKPTT